MNIFLMYILVTLAVKISEDCLETLKQQINKNCIFILIYIKRFFLHDRLNIFDLSKIVYKKKDSK